MLVGTYQQYKRDTDCFTTWLSEIAIVCGYSPKVSRTVRGSAETQVPKSNGNARTSSRRGPGREGKTTEIRKGLLHESDTRYVVTSQQLEEQARIVANCQKPRVSIPTAVLQAIERAIEARKKCLRWYEDCAQEDKVSNRGYADFIHLLERVLQTLTSGPAAGAIPKPQSAVKKENCGELIVIAQKSPQFATDGLSNKFNNKFASLKVEEGNREAESLTPSKLQEDNHGIGKIDMSIELATSKEADANFELFCFFQDLVDTQHQSLEALSRARNSFDHGNRHDDRRFAPYQRSRSRSSRSKLRILQIHASPL